MSSIYDDPTPYIQEARLANEYPNVPPGNSIYLVENERLVREDIVPAAVRGMSGSPVRLAGSAIQASLSMLTATNATFFVRTATKQRNPAMVVIQTAIYIGAITNNANLLVGNFSISSYRLRGPVRNLYYSAGEAGGSFNADSRFNLSNISGATQTINVVYLYRYVANMGDTI
jgi:hypothetical protein